MNAVSIIGGTHGLGHGLAMRLAKANWKVIIGSRKLEKAQRISKEIAETLGGKANVIGYENSRAASEADIVVFAVPFEAQETISEQIKGSLKPGTVVIDVTVPVTKIENRFALIELEESASEKLRRLLPDYVDVVAAFKNVPAKALERISEPLNCDVIVCGDSEKAKKRVFKLIEAIEGARAVDGGSLKNARLLEALSVLLINLCVIHRVDSVGVRLTGF